MSHGRQGGPSRMPFRCCDRDASVLPMLRSAGWSVDSALGLNLPSRWGVNAASAIPDGLERQQALSERGRCCQHRCDGRRTQRVADRHDGSIHYTSASSSTQACPNRWTAPRNVRPLPNMTPIRPRPADQIAVRDGRPRRAANMTMCVDRRRTTPAPASPFQRCPRRRSTAGSLHQVASPGQK